MEENVSEDGLYVSRFNRCEDDWRLALNGFTLGSCLFLLTVSLASWVVYWPHAHGYIAAIIVSLLCFTTLVYWYMRVYLKWYVALKMVKFSLFHITERT